MPPLTLQEHINAYRVARNYLDRQLVMANGRVVQPIDVCEIFQDLERCARSSGQKLPGDLVLYHFAWVESIRPPRTDFDEYVVAYWRARQRGDGAAVRRAYGALMDKSLEYREHIPPELVRSHREWLAARWDDTPK